MKLILPNFGKKEPASCLFYEDFSNNKANWEITKNEAETSTITENGYELKNTDQDRWHHFSVFPKIGNLKNIRIRCLLEVNELSSLGQIGIIWGFDKTLRRLNRFCISSSGNGCSIMHFERNHRPVFYRFFDPFFSIEKTRKVFFEIRERDNYFFFRINKKLVYIGHISNFADLGEGFGIYLDPGVSATVKKIKITKAILNRAFSLS